MNDIETICESKFQKLTSLVDTRFTAYLYDCDGTLADNMASHKEAWVVTAAKYGIDLDPAMIDEMAGTPTIKIVPVMNERYGTDIDPEEFAKVKSELYFTEYLPKCLPMDFVVKHLKESHGKVKIAIVSGSSRRTVTKTLEMIGILSYIETMVCAGDTELGKPHADPYLRAAELLEVSPADCFVFEDAPGGVAAAKAAGMEWVRVDQI